METTLFCGSQRTAAWQEDGDDFWLRPPTVFLNSCSRPSTATTWECHNGWPVWTMLFRLCTSNGSSLEDIRSSIFVPGTEMLLQGTFGKYYLTRAVFPGHI